MLICNCFLPLIYCEYITILINILQLYVYWLHGIALSKYVVIHLEAIHFESVLTEECWKSYAGKTSRAGNPENQHRPKRG